MWINKFTCTCCYFGASIIYLFVNTQKTFFYDSILKAISVILELTSRHLLKSPISIKFLGDSYILFTSTTNQIYLDTFSAEKEACFGVFSVIYTVHPQKTLTSQVHIYHNNRRKIGIPKAKKCLLPRGDKKHFQCYVFSHLTLLIVSGFSRSIMYQ